MAEDFRLFGGFMSEKDNPRREGTLAVAANQELDRLSGRGRYSWGFAAVGVLAVAVVLAQPSPPAKAQVTARPKAAPTKAAPAAPVSPAEIRRALERSFTLSGTATRGVASQNFGMQNQSWQRWTLDLNAVNGTPYRVRFGNDLMLVEASAEGVELRRSVAHDRPRGQVRGREVVVDHAASEWTGGSAQGRLLRPVELRAAARGRVDPAGKREHDLHIDLRCRRSRSGEDGAGCS
jgi:hypothetical protein